MKFQVPSSRFQVFTGLVLLLGLALAQPARAQVPVNEEAELVFDQGVEAFEEGYFGMAYRRFRLVYSGYPLNRKTTAALLMAGKALYRAGRYEEAADVLTELITRYRTSSYLDEARRVRGFARQQMQGDAPALDKVKLGITLPLREGDLRLVQALFNGIRVAVEEFNRTGPVPVQMVFRDSGGDPAQARAAVRELAREGADVIIGPLYSAEARAAGVAAEEAGVVLVAPLATEGEVSEGRRYVFQANPTITMRGRQMAEFAVRGLRLDHFGIVAQAGNSLSRRMAEGFREEAAAQGADVEFFKQIDDARGWSNLVAEVGADTLSSVEAIYVPISGGNAPRLIHGALRSLGQANVDVRVLGNAEWHDRTIEMLASRFRVTYTNDFYVDETDPAVQAFVQHYEEMVGETPSELGFTPRRLAYTGYDVARYLLSHRIEQPRRPLAEVLREAPLYQGLGLRIYFDGGNVNRALYYHRYRNGQIELLK